MSSSDNRIIKDAKISASPIVIVMHDFADLSGVETSRPSRLMMLTIHLRKRKRDSLH